MASELGPTGRALRALDLLRAQPGITAGELAAQLDVTERAVRRCITSLRDAGIPVESTRGPYGGYRLGRGVRLPPLVFSAVEALGLVMAVLDGSHAAADAEDPVGAGLGKIIRALPEHVAGPAAVMRQHAATVPDRTPRPAPETTSALVSSVAAQRRVRLGYRTASGTEWEETVDPWAVVVRYGFWYLLCHSHRVDDVRTYRIDRVRSVIPLEESFRAPRGMDPVALLERHLGRGWEFTTRVLFDAPPEEVRRYVTPWMGRLEPTADGRCVLVGTTSNPRMYAGERLAAIPIRFRVEEGPELREAVADVAARMSGALKEGW